MAGFAYIGETGSFNVLGIDSRAVCPKVVQGEAHVTGVPHDERIQDQTERTELILLTFALGLPQLTAATLEHLTR